MQLDVTHRCADRRDEDHRRQGEDQQQEQRPQRHQHDVRDPVGGDVRLDPDQAAAWLRSTNDLRLALGTRLEITEDTEPPEDLTGDEGQQLAVYYWLTALQGSLVDALAAGRAGRR